VTAPTRTPARRLLATYPSQIWWQGPPERASGVQVQQGVAGTTDSRPWAITADKPQGGGGS